MDIVMLLGSFGIYDASYLKKTGIHLTDLLMIDKIYPKMPYGERAEVVDKFSCIMESECGPHIKDPTVFLFDLAHKMSVQGSVLQNVTTDLEKDILEYLNSKK